MLVVSEVVTHFSFQCPSCQRYSCENDHTDINEWGNIVLVLYLVKWVGIICVWGYYCWNAGTVKGLHKKRPRVFFAVVIVGSFPLARDLNCKGINAQQFQVYLRLSWGSVHGSYWSNIELGGLTWGLLYVPIMCMQIGARPVRSASGHRTSGLLHVHSMTVQLGQASYSSCTGNTEGRQSKRQERYELQWPRRRGGVV